MKWEGHGDEADPKFLQAPCAEWVLCLICRVFSILNHLYKINFQIPPVFNGKHLSVYALLQEGVHVPETATLVADSSDGLTLSIKVDLNAFQSENDLLIHRYTYSIYFNANLFSRFFHVQKLS